MKTIVSCVLALIRAILSIPSHACEAWEEATAQQERERRIRANQPLLVCAVVRGIPEQGNPTMEVITLRAWSLSKEDVRDSIQRAFPHSPLQGEGPWVIMTQGLVTVVTLQ